MCFGGGGGLICPREYGEFDGENIPYKISHYKVGFVLFVVVFLLSLFWYAIGMKKGTEDVFVSDGVG